MRYIPRGLTSRLTLTIPVLVMLASLATSAVACGAGNETPIASARVGAVETEALTPVTLSGNRKLRVVATTSIVADVVSNIAGDKVELTPLLPRGVDPHNFQPAPADLRAVADADVIFANDAGLESFLSEMITNAGGEASVVSLSQDINLITPDGRANGAVDPHTWFDPNNVTTWVDLIERALSQLDATHAEAYSANAAAYVAELATLDTWIREQVAQIPPGNRKLVTDHQVLAYFAGEYGFEQVGAVIPGYSTTAEPSAQQLADLADAIRQFDVPAVFVGETVNPKVAEQLAADTGTRLVHFYAGSLSTADGHASTYLDYMRYNTAQIVSALK